MKNLFKQEKIEFTFLILLIGLTILSNCGGGGGGGSSSIGSSTSLEDGDFEGNSATGYPWIIYNGAGTITTIASPGRNSKKSGQIYLNKTNLAENKEFHFYSGSFNRMFTPDEKQINEYEVPEFATGTKFQGGVWAKIPEESPLINGSKALLRISCYRKERSRLVELSKVEVEKDSTNIDWEELKAEGEVATGTHFIWFSLILTGDNSWASGGIYFDDAYFKILK